MSDINGVADAAAPADADDGALSIEDAISRLEGAEKRDDEPTDDAPADGAPAGDQVELNDEAQPDASAVDDGEQREVEPADAPAIEPPTSWDAEAKARFAQLPAADQKYLAEREQQRDRHTTLALERAAKAEKSASIVTQLGQALQKVVPRAQQMFGERWDGVNWTELANTDPAEYVRQKANFDAEQSELQRLKTAQQVAEGQSFNQFLETRERGLQQVAPDLCDPQQGNARRTALSSYLLGNGIAPEHVRHADAAMLALAYKAQQYDLVRARSVPPAKPAAAPAGKPLRPAAAQGGNSQTRSASAARNRFAQTRSIDDAVALLNSR